MRSKKRLTLLVLMLMAMIACLIGAVACGGGVSQKDAIDMYILPQNQTLVDEDFSLPKYIGQDNAVEVKWTSSNTAAIEIVDSGDQFTAKVTLQDEVTDVTLTISAGGSSKDFTVRVDGFSVYTFIDNYSFPQLKKSISSDFDLDTSFTFQGKTATIAWSIDEQYSEYIALNEAKNGVVVTPAEEIKDVKIKATFTYGEESAPATYAFSVAPALDHRQTVNKIYSVEGYPLELSGYIVHVTEASESYGNATFYMIDDDFCSGYYCYRVKIDKSKVDKYVEGAHVTVSGDTTKNYNGLWENNSGGTATLDGKDPIDPRDHIYALDTDLLSNVPSMVWHESTLVSLSGWKIASIEPVPEKIDQTTNANIFTLQRGDVTVPVRLSKYVSRTDAEGAAFVTLLNTLKVGDYVNVTGLLGNYNNFQIQPVLASDIQKVDAEGTNTDGAKVKAAVAQVADKVKANFDALITAEKTVEMPTSVDGVTISYRVAGQDLKNVTVTIAADGKITVAPVDSEKNYDIEVTYKIGEYEGYSFFNIRNWKMSNEDLLAQVKETIEKLTIDDVKKTGAVTIPAFEDLGATVTWAPKSGSPAWLVASNGGIAVNELPDADTTVTIVATIEIDGKTETAEVSFKVQKAPNEVFQALDAPAEGDYLYAAMHKGTRLYASKLELDGNYIATTEDVSAAVKLTIAKKSDTEWYIKMGTQYLEVNPYANSNGGVSYSLRLVATPTESAVWEWDSEIKIFKQKPVATEDGVTPAAAYFYIGMRDNSDYTTMSPSDIKYITGFNAANLDVTQHPSRFGTMVSASEVSDETKAQNVLNSLKTLSQTTFKTAGEEFDLPTANNYDATVEWTVKGGSDYVTITANKLKVAATLPAADTKVTLQIEVTVGKAVVKADVEITIKAAQVEGQGFEPITSAPTAGNYLIAMEANDTWYYLTGAVGNAEYRLATTDDPAKAATFTVEVEGDGFILKCGEKYLEIVINGTYVNALYRDSRTAGSIWKWNSTYNTLTVQITGTENGAKDGEYFLGSYESYTQNMTASFVSQLSKENEYPSRLGTYKGTITPVDPTPGGDEPTPGTPLAAGNYNIVLRDETNNLVWYVTGAINNKGGLTVSHEDTTVAVLTVIYENSKYTLKIGDQYLEAYLNGTYKNMRLVDSPSSDAIEWKWSTEYSTFYAEYTDETRYLGANYYQSQVDNLYDNAVTLSKEMNFTGSNPVVIHYEAASTTPGGGDDPTPGPSGDLASTEFPTTSFSDLEALVPTSGATTAERYFAIGIVRSISDAYNSDIYITDADGNEFEIYGLFDETGKTRQQTPSADGIIKVGDTIVVFGVVTNYQGSKFEMKDAWLVQVNTEAKANVAETILNGIELPATVTEDFDLPTCGGKITWSVEGNGITIQGNVAKVTRGSQNETVKLTATVDGKTREISVLVSKNPVITEETTETLTFATNFSEYASSGWGSYGKKELLASQVNKDTNIDGTIELSWVSKQSSTITDKPVLAAKASNPAYVTISLANAKFKSITFVTAQWNSKTFSDIHIEYTTDGSQWTKCSDSITTPGTLTVTDGTDLSNATMVRLVIEATGSSNVQIGLTSISLTVLPKTAAATVQAPAQVAVVPGKQD